MTLNFQNRIVFPAPEHSYTPETAFGQVIYIPRDIRERQDKVLAKSLEMPDIINDSDKIEDNTQSISKISNENGVVNAVSGMSVSEPRPS
jgi:hypothetical protein